jgi:hypothetical protein
MTRRPALIALAVVAALAVETAALRTALPAAHALSRPGALGTVAHAGATAARSLGHHALATLASASVPAVSEALGRVARLASVAEDALGAAPDLVTPRDAEARVCVMRVVRDRRLPATAVVVVAPRATALRAMPLMAAPSRRPAPPAPPALPRTI